MAGFVFPFARQQAWSGALDLSSVTLKAAFLRTTSSVSAEQTAQALDQFTDLDEADCIGYARQTLSTVSVDLDGQDVRLLADDLDFGVLSGGSAPIGAILIFVDTGSPSTDVPVAYLDAVAAASVAFPFSPLGRDVLVEWPPEGVLVL